MEVVCDVVVAAAVLEVEGQNVEELQGEELGIEAVTEPEVVEHGEGLMEMLVEKEVAGHREGLIERVVE